VEQFALKLENVSSEAPPRLWAEELPAAVDTAIFQKSFIRTGNPGIAHFAGSLVLPTIAALTLYCSTVGWLVPLTEPYLILGILAFSLQFPGRWSASPHAIDVGKHVLTPWLVTLALLAAVGLAFGSFQRFDPRVLASWVLLTPFVQCAALYALPKAMAGLISLRRRKHRVVIVGANQTGVAFARAIRAHPVTHSEVIAFFDDREARRLGPLDDAPLAGSIESISSYVQSRRVDQIYIALPLSSQPRITRLLNSLKDSTASVFFVPDLMSIDLIQPRLDTHAGFPVVGVCESPFQGVDGAVKRASDIVISLLAIVLLSPLILLIALLVKLTSPGPVMFKQRRFGLDGGEISVWKFRSMTVTEDGDKEYVQVVRGDSRLTPIGGFLRKTSLDELPQFINRGRMR
jgi:putative colanic acid biosynthesis UDP-glucose lipid carrier transferase